MSHNRKISVIGLGYVGLTIAVSFGMQSRVVGYDINTIRIKQLKEGIDVKGEIETNELKKSNILYTTNPDDLAQADFHIITVLTPIDNNNLPDLSILLTATEMIAKRLKKGDIVVYESTVYPGATEEKCIPLLEKVSQLKCGQDFSVGYSPERINPSDKQHTFQSIVKIVSGYDKKALDIVSSVYRSAVTAGVFPVSSIRIAEATKVIENTQRDLNISLINEIALILHSLNMDTSEVIAAAKTKWNYIPFTPGLVGGHCIGVNSYYLAYKSEAAGYHPEVIFAGRRVNNYIPKFIADTTIKKLILSGATINKTKIAVLGITYKENCADLHDSRVNDLIKELHTFGVQPLVYDPYADTKEANDLYNIKLCNLEELINLDAMIITVAHDTFSHFTKIQLTSMLKPNSLIMDTKGVINKNELTDTNISLWHL